MYPGEEQSDGVFAVAACSHRAGARAGGDTIQSQGDLHVVGLGARSLAAGLDCIPLAAWVEDMSAPKVTLAASKRAFVGPAADVGFGQFR